MSRHSPPETPESFYSQQIQTLQMLKSTLNLIEKFKAKIADSMIRKEQQITIDIPKQLKQKCLALLHPQLKSVYKCEHCNKQFTDGRQLGGHVSKAHKNLKTQQKSIHKTANMDIEQYSFETNPIRKEDTIKHQHYPV